MASISSETLMCNENTIELSIPNIIGYERFAMSCIATYAKRLGFQTDRIEDLKTAVAEACLNAMQHGNKENPRDPVIVKISTSEESLVVAVIDKGNGFNVPLPEMPNIDRIVKSLDPPEGFGLLMIKTFADAIELNQKIDNGHMVKLVFKRPEAN